MDIEYATQDALEMNTDVKFDIVFVNWLNM